MTPNKQADEEVAATDAVFEELADQSGGPPPAGIEAVEPADQPAPADTSAGLPGQVGQPPVGDYVRALQEEFKQQEDEATL